MKTNNGPGTFVCICFDSFPPSNADAPHDTRIVSTITTVKSADSPDFSTISSRIRTTANLPSSVGWTVWRRCFIHCVGVQINTADRLRNVFRANSHTVISLSHDDFTTFKSVIEKKIGFSIFFLSPRFPHPPPQVRSPRFRSNIEVFQKIHDI